MLNSLKSKFILIGLVLALSQICTIVIMDRLAVVTDKFSKTEEYVYIVQSYMEADMMHDAVYGDVVAATYAKQNGQIEEMEEYIASLKSSKENILRQFDQIFSYTLDDSLRSKLENNKEAFIVYANLGLEVTQAVKNNTDYQATKAAFLKQYDTLEVANEENSDLIQQLARTQAIAIKLEADDLKTKVKIINILTSCVVLMMIFYTIFYIFKPLDKVSGVMDVLAGGNLTVDTPFVQRSDELGKLAKTLQIFKNNALEKIALEESQKRLEQEAVQSRKREMIQLANTFESSVKHIVDSVASASTEMNATSSGLANMAQDSSAEISHVTDTLGSTSKNVQTVASATTELSASIQEISRQMSRSASVTNQAVSEATKAESTVQALSAAANKIGEVVSLISDIASQINLLALNATIESARAGEAGKGFAVVASEVKNLAGETTKATEEISNYIKSIQDSTSETVTAINKVGVTIREINQISTTIASAVEEQGVATQSIASNVEEASRQTLEVAREIASVQTKANETGVSSGEMLAAASELSQQAEKLRKEVDHFISNIRNNG
jgi:methyl-accepting chemotaxis protein